jgi:zinc protease
MVKLNLYIMIELDRTKAPAFQPIRTIELLKANSTYLDNGAPLHTLKAGSQLVAGLEIIFQAGSWFESYKGISYFTSKMLTEGTSSMTGEQIMEKLSSYGAFIEASHSLDQVSLSVYCLSRYLKDILPVITEMITDSVIPQEELDNIKRITQQNLQVNLMKTSYLASVRFREKIFGAGHPYGSPMKQEDIEAVNREAVKDYYSIRIATANFEVMLSGQFTDEHIKYINETLGAIKRTSVVQSARAVEAGTDKPLTELMPKPDAVQASLRMGRRMFTRNHPDYLKMKVLNEILGGYFGSRLMKNIREEKGYTYGIHSSLLSLQHEGYMVIGTDINKDVANQTVEEVYKEMALLKQEPVDHEELETVRNYMLGSLANSITTPFALMDKFKSIHFSGLGYDYYDRMINTYASITAEELQDLAKRYLKEEDMVVVVAGGESK